MTTTYFKKTIKTIAVSVLLLCINSFFCIQAYSQIDYSYGRNTSGIRVAGGIGLATLATHFHSNPPKPVYLGSVSYDFNPYLSIGVEAQKGTLQGIDDVNHLYYGSSTNQYFTGTLNIRVALGQLNDFTSTNTLQDALKRIYVGLGAGFIKNAIKLTQGANQYAQPDGNPVLSGSYLVIPINLGTNIDLPGIFGIDKLSINPNYQFNYVKSRYADGFISSIYSKTNAGYYNLFSIQLKYKF